VAVGTKMERVELAVEEEESATLDLSSDVLK